MTTRTQAMLTLYLPGSEERLRTGSSIQGMVDQLYRGEVVSYVCDACRCQGHRLADGDGGSGWTQQHVLTAPEVLLIHVQRVFHGRGGSYKGSQAVDVNQDLALQLSWYVYKRGSGGCSWEQCSTSRDARLTELQA